MFKKSYKLRTAIEEEEKIEKESKKQRKLEEDKAQKEKQRLLEEENIQKGLQEKVGTFF